MNSLIAAIKAFVLKSRPAYKDDLGNGKYDIKKLPEECIPDTVTNKISKAQSTADAAQSTADAARRKAQSTAENISPGKTWTQSNLTSISSYAIYYADGIWVAGSFKKGLFYATDGKTWTQSNITSDYNITALYYDDGIWVAGSVYKGLYYSTDGKTWAHSNITSIGINDIYYADGIWVAGSKEYGLYYSTDGKTWTQSNLTSINIYTIYYDDGIWVAGSNEHGLYYSTDGKTWTQSNLTSISINALYYADGIWVAGSYIFTNTGLYYSTDGKTWTQSDITSIGINTIYYDDGIWVAGSNEHGLYYSTDGKTWTQSDITSIGIKAIYYADGIWVAGSMGQGLYYSTDGKTWTQSDITSTNKILALCYADGIWVAGSYESGLYYSQPKFAFAKTVDNEISEINQSMNQFQRIGDDVIINSSTPDSTKKFKITTGDDARPTFTDTSNPNNTWTPGDNLPTVTASDSGKFLRVSENGEWIADVISDEIIQAGGGSRYIINGHPWNYNGVNYICTDETPGQLHMMYESGKDIFLYFNEERFKYTGSLFYTIVAASEDNTGIKSAYIAVAGRPIVPSVSWNCPYKGICNFGVFPFNIQSEG